MSNASDFIIENGVLTKYVGSGEDVVIPEGVTEIGQMAFLRCDVKKVHIPEGVTRIGNWAFDRCSNLLSVVLPVSVTEIGKDVFFCCESLVDITLPDGVQRIGPGAFSGCKRLRSLRIPESVTELGEGAFRECRGLADEKGFVIIQDTLFGYYGPSGDVGVPDGVRQIDYNAYYDICLFINSRS